MDAASRQFVRSRAGDCCEYCQLPQSASPLAPLEIEHIIPRKHHGDDSTENLALACFHCNCHKGANLAGIDPDTGLMTRLFHPRNDQWSAHFQWVGLTLTGLTPVGRATIDVLQINAEDVVRLREALS